MPAIQFGNIAGVDLTFKNFGVTDIPAGLCVLADSANVGGGDVPGGVVLPTAAGGVAGTMGITVETIPAGKSGKVRISGGTYPTTANGTVTYGTFVQASDTASKLGWAKTCGAATRQIGIALNTATDGNPLLVFIAPANNA